MDALCIDGSMKVEEWIRLAATLDIDGLEFYSGFLEMEDPKNWSRFRSMVEEYGMCIPMLCCSPDFTHPDPDFRQQQIELEKKWIDMTAALGGKYCRVLSGQKRPELIEEEGIQYTIECIEACLPYAENNGIHLVIENHYKDNYWTYPEFAQMSKVFVQIVNGISNPFFGVNFDPSNTILAGEDPLDWFLDLTTEETAKLPFEEITARQIRCRFKGATYGISLGPGRFSRPGRGIVFRMAPEKDRLTLHVGKKDQTGASPAAREGRASLR